MTCIGVNCMDIVYKPSDGKSFVRITTDAIYLHPTTCGSRLDIKHDFNMSFELPFLCDSEEAKQLLLSPIIDLTSYSKLEPRDVRTANYLSWFSKLNASKLLYLRDSFPSLAIALKEATHGCFDLLNALDIETVRSIMDTIDNYC